MGSVALAVQIGKALGASPVIGTASTEERRNFVLELGADAAIGYDEPNWTATVLEHTGGRGVDVLIESIGGDVFEQNFQALATFGRYLLLGSTRGPVDPFAPRRLMTKSQAMVGFYLPVFYDRPELIGNALRFLADGVKDGFITAKVDSVLPLALAAEAHRRLEDRAVRGVIVLDPTLEPEVNHEGRFAYSRAQHDAHRRAHRHPVRRVPRRVRKGCPPLTESVRRIVAAGGSWHDVLAAAAANAPNDLMVYAVIDADELLVLAGHRTHAVEYLLGNHTIAETMFRHDPRALLYAPLRVSSTATMTATRCSLLTSRALRSAASASTR